MKLRIKGNSLRFRLNKVEVETFGSAGYIEDKVEFGSEPNTNFHYRIEKTAAKGLAGSFEEGRITVFVPESTADQWIDTDQVGIEGTHKFDDQTELYILIEKDFVCLTAPAYEDQSDNYPHPKGDKNC